MLMGVLSVIECPECPECALQRSTVLGFTVAVVGPTGYSGAAPADQAAGFRGPGTEASSRGTNPLARERTLWLGNNLFLEGG